ncbi:MAG: transketolase [Chlamydiae bacterium RIFCSPHIGHO2_12_FULL_27_8]|nr:MAG: transketolase [Chlamydiae bacterium RIFCSPHIGHO2_12_FULL_27_8]
MDIVLKNELKKVANTVRGLSIDAIEKAKSGHPGLPLGCAELGAYIYGVLLNHNPKNSTWINRDRFILSAGHGSMLLYSLLYLSGFKVTIEEIRDFRQLGSKTPGHPEAHITDGVEATTGPLGHGIGNAIGMAIAMKILKQKFNTEKYKLINNKIYVLAGDGCMMEGAVSEASSIAGHLRLNNLVIIYDSNKISLDGPTSESISEDTKTRYRSYGFDVYEIDGHDFDAIEAVFNEINEKQTKPVLIVANTIIGKGSPHKAGTHKVHGSPLGADEVKNTKIALNLPLEDFYVPQSVLDFFKRKQEKEQQIEDEWNKMFSLYAKENSTLFEEFKIMQNKTLPLNFEKILKNIDIKQSMASRESSGKILNYLADILPFLYSGSADLSSSDKSYLDKYQQISFDNFLGRNFKFGVREFAMGTISNGLALSDFFIPVCGTFLVFSDYMRNAIRLAALTKLQVIYHFTHDSIFLGEDGPTHQPVEHLASLRAMPNLNVLRPCDVNEVKMSYYSALTYKGPTALILSRQKLLEIPGTNLSFEEGFSKGAYIIKKENNKPDFTIFASGSEVRLALEVAENLIKLGKDVRVVSVPSFNLFDNQSHEYKQKIIKGDLGKRISIEAASSFGWEKFIGIDGIAISVDTFGKSAPIDKLQEEFGFLVDSILQRVI